MNGILLLDIILLAIACILLFVVPAIEERRERNAWRARMKRAALRHCVYGNSEYGQSRYNVMRGH